MLGLASNLVVPFVATVMFIAALGPRAHYLGLIDKPGGRKAHSGEVPLVGGICMLAGLVAAVLSLVPWGAINSALLVGAVFLGLVGAIDDRYDLPPSVRLVAQALAGFVVISSGTVVGSLGQFGGTELHLGLLAMPFTLLTVVAFTNAFNWQDGSDGIAGGQALIVFVALLAVDAVSGNGEHANMLTALIGCVLAFLLFNAPFAHKAGPYRLFMGDAGALSLGFALAWFAIAMSQGPDAVIAPVTALWLGALPVLDFFGSMARRVSLRRNPLAADAEHLHHLLKRAGLTRRKLFLVEMIACTGFATIGLLGHFLEVSQGVMISAMGLIAVVYYWVFCSGRFFQREGEPPRSVHGRYYWPLPAQRG
jgi:UDP-GlcNAc:undecaprenyl-phosphate GlcNAc-1-phosphate transferase